MYTPRRLLRLEITLRDGAAREIVVSSLSFQFEGVALFYDEENVFALALPLTEFSRIECVGVADWVEDGGDTKPVIHTG